MDARLSLKDRAEALAADFATRAAAYDRDGSFPFENFEQLAEAGLLALTVPRSAGGEGGGLTEAAAVINAVGKADPATALVLTMQYQHLAAISRSNRWPAALVKRLQQEAIDEVSLINALRVEPDLGSPARGGLPNTIARRTQEGWRISGHKVYSTGVPILRWYLVWARTDEEEPRVGMFLMRAGTPGIRIEETWDHLGLRASGSHDVYFDDVLVPLDHAADIRLPAEWREPDALQMCGNAVLLSSIYDGVARAARDWLVGFLRDRKPSNLGASLATLPRIQEAVGGIEAKLAVNARLIESLALEADCGTPPPPNESALVKLAVTENAIAVVEEALKLSGNHGLSRANPLERHHRDVLCARVHTPQDDSIRLAAGKAALAPL